MPVKTPIPYGPHHDSVTDPRLNLHITAAGVLLNFCPRHRVASLYLEQTGRWTMRGPITASEFANEVMQQGLDLPREAVELWLAQIEEIEIEMQAGAQVH